MQAFTLTLNLPTLGAIAAAAWFFWMRYQSLETRLRQIEVGLIEERHSREINRKAVLSDRDQMTYLTNANRELIEHRSQRFQDAIDRMEVRLQQDITEVKSFLNKTTDFKPRNQVDS